eukprot:scaffold1183_cov418-Prasinococcus_capsulatus_cf.AAC.39
MQPERLMATAAQRLELRAVCMIARSKPSRVLIVLLACTEHVIHHWPTAKRSNATLFWPHRLQGLAALHYILRQVNPKLSMIPADCEGVQSTTAAALNQSRVSPLGKIILENRICKQTFVKHTILFQGSNMPHQLQNVRTAEVGKA